MTSTGKMILVGLGVGAIYLLSKAKASAADVLSLDNRNAAVRPGGTRGHETIPPVIADVVVDVIDNDMPLDAAEDEIIAEGRSLVAAMETYIVDNQPGGPDKSAGMLEALSDIDAYWSVLDGTKDTADVLSSSILELRVIVNSVDGIPPDPLPDDYLAPYLTNAVTTMFDIDIAWRAMHELDLGFIYEATRVPIP